METEITKKISPNKLIEIFDKHSDKVNIRFYKPKIKQNILDFDTKIFYSIRIRHAEDEVAKDLLNKVIKEIS